MDAALKEKKRERRRFRLVTAVLIAVIMLVLFLIQGDLQIHEKRKSAERSAEILLTKTEDILLKNKEDEAALIASLKEDYIIRAKAAAYILENEPAVAGNIDELRKIADFLQIDELHLFDVTGTIRGGTNPEYYGYSFDSGEQMAFFKPILTDRKLSLCQDITPNTATGKAMMYALVWREDGKGLVQIGLKPTRLLEQMKKNDIAYLTANMPVAEGVTIYIANPETGRILGATQKELVDRQLSTIGFVPPDGAVGETLHFSADIQGKPCYCISRENADYVIGVSELRSAVNKGLPREMLLVFVYLFFVAAALTLVIWRSTAMVDREREKRVREQQVKNRLLAETLKKAESANRSKTTFLFNMSHDIRTPMNAIMGFTELAERHADDPDAVRSDIGKIRRSSEVLLKIINDVLDLARIESGKAELELAPHDLTDCVHSAHDMFAESMEKAGVRFTVETLLQDRVVLCDDLRIEQILINLLGNAQKFTPAGGSVQLRLEQLGEKQAETAGYRLTVRDTGIGMSAEFLSHVFDAFERERSSTVTGVEGTGLGLCIVKNLTEMMGGAIRVESAPGRGTEFTLDFSFPVVVDAAIPEKAETSGPTVDFTGKRLLLAEDNELNREIACELLTCMGFCVDTVEDGVAAVEKVACSQPGDYDLILMDIQMPRMNGYEATEEIRQLPDPSLAYIPVVAMTANAFEEDRRKAAQSGMNGFLSKPVDTVRMAETLQAVFRASEHFEG